MKTIDCPLCSQKDAISIGTESEKTFTPRPGPKGVYGNYSIDFSPEKDDWSHAETCPQLEKAFDKKGLLKFYVYGEYLHPIKSDIFSFEDYEKAIREQLSLHLEVQVWRKDCDLGKKEWKYTASLKIDSRSSFLDSTADSPDKAFSLLRHRLLCGDIIRKKYQLINTTGTLLFIEI